MAAITNAGPCVEFTIEGDVNQGETIYAPALGKSLAVGSFRQPKNREWFASGLCTGRYGLRLIAIVPEASPIGLICGIDVDRRILGMTLWKNS